MTANQWSRIVTRYGQEWAAELADYLIRLFCWRAAGRVSPRRVMIEVAQYVRAVRPKRQPSS